ncbi:MAG: DNA polymerase I [Firmicutes bacterium HGW-Firmicutes-8]|nr:MAG: DNA polymerase I [Firmicutes bacterium HGW-Firmicutes-8]
MILDGNSLIYRAFYAIPLLTTSEGLFTNAVYGFVNMLTKILADEKPKCVAVAFDKGKVTFRTEQYEQYKGHRKPTPEELRPQFALAKEVLEAMDIPVYELEGFEADDLIGTVTRLAEEGGYRNLIVTGDRDTLQLVSPATEVLLTKKGISQLERYNPEKVGERYGLTPYQVIDLKGLMGDPSDNIPGVPGVGEKTALKLVQEFGSMENLYENLDGLPPKLKEKLLVNRDIAFLSKKLATIVRDVPYEVDLSQCHYGEPDYGTLLAIFRKLEFRTLIKSVTDKMKTRGGPVPEPTSTGGEGLCEYLQLSLADALDKLAHDLDRGEVGIHYEISNPDPMLAELTGFSWCAEPGSANYVTGVSFGQTELFREGENVSGLASLIGSRTGLKKYCHDGKKLLVSLDRYGIRWESIEHDTMLAAYLLNPAGQNQDLADLSAKYLEKNLVPASAVNDACSRADVVMSLQKKLADKLAENGMDELYYEVELPLARILADMEITGVKVDRGQLEVMSGELAEKLDTITADIYRLAGEEFNINSTKQLGYIFFEKLNLPVIKKTKTGYSTDVEVLERLADEHEIVARILEYRQLSKLKSTYVDGLAGLINPRTGKLHTTFNQTVTATGRLSSTEPNLQNIPVRLEEGRRIRKVFVPAQEGHFLLAADYSQIELRVLAHISGDENFIRAFRAGEDIHTHTASEVFGVPDEEVTKEMRDSAKAVNFGIVYGISDFGLARSIKVGRKEARSYIDGYFRRYPGIKRFMDDIVVKAREQGYVSTIMNRRRYLPDIFSPNRNVRGFGERTAMNTPIQGSAADIIKLAMVRVNRKLKETGLKSKMVLQVHDELIFEVPGEEMDRIIPLIRDCMENAVKLDVPLVVDMKKGFNWYNMEKIHSK